MKSLILLMIPIVFQVESLQVSSFFDVIADKFLNLANTLRSTFKNIYKSITNFVTNKYEKQLLNTFSDRIVSKNKDKIVRALHKYAEENSEESAGDEDPEYLVFKSEPTALMTTSQLAKLHGYKVESHTVKTEDGYFLTLHRILNIHQNNSTMQINKTVLLHHGLLGSSADWLLLGPEKSLPYILLNAGYDVWLANARGNYYSRKHASKSIDGLDFWNFSWHEMGVYDLPAVINYMKLSKNLNESIIYIGHSMGATAVLVLLSVHPRYNKEIRIAILLAPLALLSNVDGPVKALNLLGTDPSNSIINIIGPGEFIPSRKVPKMLSDMYCSGKRLLCNNPLFFLSGSKLQNLNASFAARVLYHVPAGGSTKTIFHYSQVLSNKRFHKYDDSADEYNLAKVTVPIVLFSSNDDLLASVPDVLHLYFNVSNPIEHVVIQDKNISHTDFAWGSNADVLIYSKIKEILKNIAIVNATSI